MSDTATQAHAGHHELGFLRKYVFSTDHKVIGIQFLFTGLLMMVIGGLLAILVRWQLAWPSDVKATIVNGEMHVEGHPIPVLSTVQWGTKDEATGKTIPGNMPNSFYNMAFTMHATIMIFFVIIPLLTGAFGNFTIPLMIGAPDMAWPFLNGLSYWLVPIAGSIMMAGFFTDTGAAASGWTSYPILAAVSSAAPGSGIGQTCWLISLIILGTGSILGSLNYLTTIIKMRAPGMTMFRMPLTVWSLFITSVLVLFATPVLASALAMMLLDRQLGTNFFVTSGLIFGGQPLEGHVGGGQPLFWQHIFWFYSHPAVYIMILPAMGMTSDIISTFSRKPIFGYKPMVFSIVAIAGLGFIVWGHHMFQSGMHPGLGMTFMVSTMFIALPSAVKTFNWLGTVWGGNVQLTSAMLNALAFVAMFVIGGLSGIFMASATVDIFIHDTYFIVAHIHYVLFGGSLFGIFAGIYYWFPKMFGRLMHEGWGKIHFWLTFIAYNCTFFPMHILGVRGMPRRVANYLNYETFADLQNMNKFVTMSAFTLGVVQVIFAVNFLYSMFYGKKTGPNPWKANSLEWSCPSPPPHGNFYPIPEVYRGPYEFSSPAAGSEDYLPQDKRIDVPEPTHHH